MRAYFPPATDSLCLSSGQPRRNRCIYAPEAGGHAASELPLSSAAISLIVVICLVVTVTAFSRKDILVPSESSSDDAEAALFAIKGRAER